MATNYVCVAHLPARSGITADETQNVFAVTGPGADVVADTEGIAAKLQTFYRAIQGLLSPQLGSAPYITFYDATNALSLSPPNNILGAPVNTFPFTWSGGFSGNANVEECAITLSMKADMTGLTEYYLNKRPRAHRRGRLYLGPLNTLPLSVDATTGRTLVSSSARTTIVDAATALRDAMSPYTWCIWSREDRAFYPVVNGWVDNAFDTQRRRGPKATARTSF